MRKLFAVVIISSVLLCGCGQNATLTPTIVPLTVTSSPSSSPKSTAAVTLSAKNTETPWPTLIYYLYPTITPDPNRTALPPKPTITAPPPRNPPIILPEGLKIDEYEITVNDIYDIQSLASFRYPNKGGWHYWPKGGILDGKLFLASERVREHLYSEIHATLDKTEIFSIDCGKITPLPAVITAWTYGQHWIIQSVCQQEFDIFWDGISLNTSKGYQSSFAFQILGKYPFYLFKRNGQTWLSYNEQETLLGYDEVELTYCCETYPPPKHYENLITFYAVKNEKLYYVAIGLNE